MPTIKAPAKVSVLPNNGYAPSNDAVASHLREQADWIEKGDESLRNAYVILETTDGVLRVQNVGQPC